MASRISYPKVFQALLNLHGFLSEKTFCTIMKIYHPNAYISLGTSALNKYVFEHGDQLEFIKDSRGDMLAFKKGGMDISYDVYMKCFMHDKIFYLYVPKKEEEFLSFASSYEKDPSVYIDSKTLNDFRIFLRHALKKPNDYKRLYEASLKYAPRLDFDGLEKELGKIPLPDSRIVDFAGFFFDVGIKTRRPTYGGFTLEKIQDSFDLDTLKDCEPFEYASSKYGFLEKFDLY